MKSIYNFIVFIYKRTYNGRGGVGGLGYIVDSPLDKFKSIFGRMGSSSTHPFFIFTFQ